MDQETKKKVLRQITYGLYLLSARADNDAAAAAVTWLSQASFTPPLLMVALKADSHLHALVQTSRAFAVSIVPEDQKELGAAFFKASTVQDGRINGYAFENGPSTGAPLLLDLPNWIEARVVEEFKRGDHTVFVAEVVNAGLRREPGKPLVLSEAGWSYGG